MNEDLKNEMMDAVVDFPFNEEYREKLIYAIERNNPTDEQRELILIALNYHRTL
jgi:hypothetical protein